MQILWGIVILSISVSTLEIIFFYNTRKTWIEFLYADKQKLSIELQNEAIQHKSMYKCFT